MSRYKPLADYTMAGLLNKHTADCTPDELARERKRIIQVRVARKNTKTFGILDCTAAKSLKKRVGECTRRELDAQKIKILDYRNGIGIRTKRSAGETQAANKSRTLQMPDYYIRGVLVNAKVEPTPDAIAKRRAQITATREKRARWALEGLTKQQCKNETDAAYRKRQATEIFTCYIAQQFKMRICDIPPELIEAKRMHLKLHRKLKAENEKRI